MRLALRPLHPRKGIRVAQVHETLAVEAMHAIERKMDSLLEKMNKLILVEERQQAQGKRIGDIETRMAADSARVSADLGALRDRLAVLDGSLNTVRNRILGSLAIVTLLFSAYKSDILADVRQLLVPPLAAVQHTPTEGK